MARQYSFSARAPHNPLTALILGFALLAAPLACGSDSDEGGDDDAQTDTPRPVPARNERPVTTQPEPSADQDDEDDPAANPAPMDDKDTPSESPAAPGANTGDSNGVPPAPAAAFASCTRSEGSYGTNCDYVYVTMTQTSPERCVQLTIDNCGDSYTRQGLGVDAPLSWQLSSASIGSSPDACELGVFDPESTIVVDASGEISWDDIQSAGALPSGIVLDVTLQPASTADDTSSVEVVTAEPLNPARCED